MGWFKKARKWCGNALDKAIDVVVDVADTTVEIVKDIGEGVGNFIDATVDTVSSLFSKEAQHDDGSIDAEEYYAKKAAKYREEMIPKCHEVENKIMRLYQTNYAKLKMEESPFGYITQHKVKNAVINGESYLENTLIDHINSRVSKDCDDFCKIIDIYDDEKRGSEIAKYLAQTKIDAVNKMMKRTKKVMKDVDEYIDSLLTDDINKVEIDAKKSLEEFEKIQNIDGEDLKRKQEELIKNGVIISQCEYIIDKCN